MSTVIIMTILNPDGTILPAYQLAQIYYLRPNSEITRLYPHPILAVPHWHTTYVSVDAHLTTANILGIFCLRITQNSRLFRFFCTKTSCNVLRYVIPAATYGNLLPLSYHPHFVAAFIRLSRSRLNGWTACLCKYVFNSMQIFMYSYMLLLFGCLESETMGISACRSKGIYRFPEKIIIWNSHLT